jgi:phage terminase small subunit
MEVTKMNWNKFPHHLRPGKHWPTETRRRIEDLITEYGIDDVAGLLLLQQYGNSEAREIQAREQIAAEGQTVLDRFDQQKPHPLLATERDARSQKLHALKALNLDVEPLNDRPGRP